MMRQFYACGLPVRPPFEFEADCLVQRPNPLGKEFSVKHLLRERVAKMQFAGCATPVVHEMQRMRAF